MKLSEVTNLSTRKRHPCLFCTSSDGLSIDDKGETGVYYCFSCHARGDGIDLLRKGYGYSFQEAADVLGKVIDDSEEGRRLREKARLKRNIKQRRKEEAIEAVMRSRQLREYMTDEERHRHMEIGRMPEGGWDEKSFAESLELLREFESRVARRILLTETETK